MTEQIEWRCDVCEFPIADWTGYLAVSRNAISKFQRDWADWAESAGTPLGDGTLYSPTDLRAAPRPARWESLHQKCDPAPTRSDEWIPVARLRTFADLLSATLDYELGGYGTSTDWRDLMWRALASNRELRGRS